jgi:catechol 2,3-dioxygenase-like lactoylglutathione lyase family enzyme
LRSAIATYSDYAFQKAGKHGSEDGKLMFVHIRTSNMDKSIDFYTKFLGLKLVNRREIPRNNAEIAVLRDAEAKGSTLELTFYRNQKKFIQADYEDRVFDHLAF